MTAKSTPQKIASVSHCGMRNTSLWRGLGIERLKCHGTIRRAKIDANAELRMSHRTGRHALIPSAPDIRLSNGDLIRCASSRARDFLARSRSD